MTAPLVAQRLRHTCADAGARCQMPLHTGRLGSLGPDGRSRLDPSVQPPIMARVGMLGALWGVGGWVLLIAYAIMRLTPYAVDGLSEDLDWRHWLIAAVIAVFMAYSEGYRGFQKSFSPRLSARARALRDDPSLGRVLLSPLYCAGYFGSSARRMVSVYGVTATVLLAIILVRTLDQPWRGIADAGVIVGLGWGLLTLLGAAVQAVRSRHGAPLGDIARP